MSTYLPTVFGENLFDVFDDFDRDFFRGFGVRSMCSMARMLAA